MVHVRCVEAKTAREVPEATPKHIGIRNLNEQSLDKLEMLSILPIKWLRMEDRFQTSINCIFFKLRMVLTRMRRPNFNG